MTRGHRQIVLLLLLLASSVSVRMALGKKKEKQDSASAQMAERKRAAHALNRLAFGPRPGDIEQVLAMGVDKWIDQQLQADKIDDAAMDARLQPFRTLRMGTKEIVQNFPPEPVIQAIANGKRSLPADPLKRAIYQAQLQSYQEKQERKQETATSNSAAGTGTQSTDNGNRNPAPAPDRGESSEDAEAMLDLLPPEERVKAILQMSPEQQRALSNSLKGDMGDELLEGMNPRQQETVMALSHPQQVVVKELVQAKLLRAVYSQRQLEEVMVDFWFNHFNVFIGKGADHYLLTGYERDVIRPHALGKFEDLLVATAQSPAMLFYLDNWMSVGPDSEVALGIQRNNRRRGRPRQNKRNRNGLNENYARELMELHTLGVNGGYTQEDVTEVARIFTGWTLKQPRQGGGFTFRPRMHEPGDKVVLGHRIKQGGEREGLELLHLLAHDPSTANFICKKLVIRFVSDDPPPALVDRMAQTFLKNDGDIREVLKTLFSSPEFWAPEAYRAKVKTPLEFVVSALRASDAEVSDAVPIARQLQSMGMPLYGMQPPTGYSMKADAWVNSSALLGRMNFAMALSSGKLKGTQVDSARLLDREQKALVKDGERASAPVGADPRQILAALENSLLAGEVSKQTHAAVAARLNDPQISRRKLDDPERAPNAGVIEGLLLGSSEFQRR